jgi:aromatic amino acid aminotransferase I
VIVEEYTYPSAQAYTIPMGIKAVPIPADAEGIEARELEDVLDNWSEAERGGRRPRL